MISSTVGSGFSLLQAARYSGFESAIPANRRLGCRTGQSSKYSTSCARSEEHTSELQSRLHLVCRLLLEKKKPPSEPEPGNASLRTDYRVRQPRTCGTGGVLV